MDNGIQKVGSNHIKLRCFSTKLSKVLKTGLHLKIFSNKHTQYRIQLPFVCSIVLSVLKILQHRFHVCGAGDSGDSKPRVSAAEYCKHKTSPVSPRPSEDGITGTWHAMHHTWHVNTKNTTTFLFPVRGCSSHNDQERSGSQHQSGLSGSWNC